MGAIATAGNAAFRDYNTDGVPASLAYNPAKSPIRDLMKLIDGTTPTVFSPFTYGAVGDGFTDDTSAINACLTAAARTLSASYVDALIVVDFEGLTYAISATVSATSHPWTLLCNGKLKAIGSGWSSSTYMLNAQGASATSNLGFMCTLAFECARIAAGMAIANAYRCWVKPKINHFIGNGLYVGSAVGLGQIDGYIHEVEASDSDFTTYTRVGTGIYLDSGAGDIYLDAKVGWSARCLFNGASGPVHIRGHFYCSSTTVAIYGISYEQANGANAILEDCYLDTGDIIYHGGELQIASSCNLYHLSGVTPSQISDHYILAAASSSGQFALLTIDANVARYDRTVPLIKTDTTSGTWANLAGPILTGNQAVQAVTDPMLVHQMSAVQVFLRSQTNVSGSYIEMYDSATASPPRIGAIGDDLILWHSSAPRWAALVTGGTNYAFVPWADNVYSLGTGGNRPSVIFAGSGTINTSDETEKTAIVAVPDAVLDAWGDVEWSEYSFKGGKRTHHGLISQRVADCFTKRGLNPFQYGIICVDKWDAAGALLEPDIDQNGKPHLDADGKPQMREIRPARAAGERWGVRYDEAMALESAWQRREIARLKAKLPA